MILCYIIAALTLSVPESPYLGDSGTVDKVPAVATLDADGFKVGRKFLKADSAQNIFVYTDGGRAQFKVFARVRPEFKYYSPVKGQKGILDGDVYRRESPVEVLKSKTGPQEKVAGKYISILEKLPDGKCRMTFDVECQEAERVVNATQFIFDRDFLDSLALTTNHWERPERIEFRDRNGTCAFAFEFDPKEIPVVALNGENGNLAVRHSKPRFSVTLDPGETFVPKTPPFLAGGIDFRAESGVNVAEYQSSPNILINPSFEPGDRYWRVQVASDVRDIITNGVAHSGKRSLVLKTGIGVQSVGTVLKSDTDYIFSAWIRPVSGAGGARIKISPRGIRRKETMLRTLELVKQCNDGDWERVSDTFRTPVDFHECVLWLDGKDVLVDDIQLEEGSGGSVPTEYCGNPFGLELVHDQETLGYVDSKKPQNLRLRVSGPANAKGTLAITASDFFERSICTNNVTFNLGDAGEQIVPLVSDAELPLGTTVFTVKVQSVEHRTSNVEHLSYTDYLRITKIDARDGTDRLRGLQGSNEYGRNKPDVSRPKYGYERLRDFGFGSLGYCGNHNGTTDERLSHDDVDNLARYGLKDRWGAVAWTSNWRKTLNGKPWEWEGKDIRSFTNYPSALLNWVESETEEMAKKHPWLDFWAIDTEPGCHWQSLKDGNVTEYVKLMLSMNRGLIRANSNNVFIPYGACNMSPKSGIPEVIEFLEECNKLEPETKFKEIEIHTYRPFPEHPDVDSDLTFFLSELDRIGYRDMNIKTGEGSYYYPMWRPSNDLYSWSHVSGKDRYSSIPIPTYDIGWGERIGAALVTRETLVYFKHQDRVNVNCCWCPRIIDSYSPIAWTAANAALMSLLGNSTFLEDIRFAKNCRAYVFDDGRGNTVAAVWRADVRFDRGHGRPVPMSFDRVNGLEIFDLMGNKVSAECGVRNAELSNSKVPGENHSTVQPFNRSTRETTLPLSGFPFYLRVPDAQRDSFVAALKNAKIEEEALASEALFAERTTEATYVDGKVPDWAKIPSVTDGDCSWQLVWNETGLHVRVRGGEPVNVYFDGFGNARTNFIDGVKGYDYDDFVFTLRPLAAHRSSLTTHECYRLRAADLQYTGGAGVGPISGTVDEKVRVVRSGDTLEVFFPATSILPLKPVVGARFGFAVEHSERNAYAGKPEIYYQVIFGR